MNNVNTPLTIDQFNAPKAILSLTRIVRAWLCNQNLSLRTLSNKGRSCSSAAWAKNFDHEFSCFIIDLYLYCLNVYEPPSAPAGPARASEYVAITSEGPDMVLRLRDHDTRKPPSAEVPIKMNACYIMELLCAQSNKQTPVDGLVEMTERHAAKCATCARLPKLELDEASNSGLRLASGPCSGLLTFVLNFYNALLNEFSVLELLEFFNDLRNVDYTDKTVAQNSMQLVASRIDMNAVNVPHVPFFEFVMFFYLDKLAVPNTECLDECKIISDYFEKKCQLINSNGLA